MSSIDKKIIEKDLRIARSYAAKHLPWFAIALFRCRIVLNSKVPLAAIDDHYNIYWNPENISKIINQNVTRTIVLQELAFIWIHEICHVLREHGPRATHIKAKAKRWNIAADLEINDSQWKGLKGPALFPPIMPQQFNLPIGKTVEWYYNNEQVEDCCKDSNSKNKSNSNCNSEKGGSERKKNKMSELFDKLGDEGSGVHGKPSSWEIEDENPQKLTPSEQLILKHQTANEVGKMPGKIPGKWADWAKEVIDPYLDWKKLLRKKLSRAIAIGMGYRIDYTFQRPNRKASIYSPFILPRLSGDMKAEIAVVIDTSGSMRGLPLNKAMVELHGVLMQMRQKITMIPCDVIGYAPVTLKTPSDIMKLVKLPGGGGTNMINGIDAALRLKPKPDAILVLTDGFTPYPQKRYKVPVIFGIIGNTKLHQNATPPNPPWGKDTIVFIDLNR